MFTKDIKTRVKTISGNTVEFNSDNTKSRTYTSSVGTTSSIALGTAGADSLSFKLSNTTGYWDSIYLKKATLTPMILGENLSFPLGVFLVETADKVEGAINVNALDRMVDFDVKFLGATFPCTIGHIVKVICDQIGITLKTPTFTNSEVVVKSGERLKGASCRNILISCCEVSGCFSKIDELGQLVFDWYDFSDIKTTFKYRDFKTFKADEAPIQISGIEFWQDEDHYRAGTDDLQLSLSNDNPLLDGLESEGIQAVIDTIYDEKIKMMGYLPCTFKTSDFRELRAGDVIKVETEKGQEYPTIITELRIIDNLEMQITCAGKAKVEEQRYTQGMRSPGQGDPGDKIGYVLGESNRAYAFTNSTQTVAACALGLDVDTRVAVQLLATYQFSPDEETNAPLITLEYRVNGATQMTFYQYPHSGMNTFSTAFIPSAQKPGTASIDLRLTVLGGGVALEKRQAQISLLVKNGNVVDTPPWPEINISQSFNAITVLNNSEMIRVVALGENVMVDTAEPQAGAISQDFTAINILPEGLVNVTAMFDNLSLARVIKGEILKFNKAFKARYTYTEKYMAVGTDFKEEQAYLFDGVEGVIDSGKLFEIPISTTEFKAINGLEVI